MRKEIMGFKNAVCIYPYFQEVPIYEFFPPLGLEYVAAAMEDQVDDICIVDLRYNKNISVEPDADASSEIAGLRANR